MADPSSSVALRTIFSFFLGLMLTAFVGVGVYTFHPPPDRHEAELRDLSSREQAINQSRRPGDLTEADRQQLQQIQRQRDALNDATAAARKPWGRSTSIILILFATLAMAVSLVRADQLPVISNGLLLGGLFTMLYGVGWIIATDSSVARFLVMTGALIITLGLGYVRFVRRSAGSPAAAGAAAAGVVDVSGIESRVRRLEERLDGAASALAAGKEREPRA